ncbi:glycoside hydrolase family 16 protein [Piloderma croceum F 1598]|uniref:Glycoside hydrolase family 16 protein n=1 Tax=Piloderma croceum (strain F 1598) TaxID=765440 RepID=A0A0C3GJ17_PILCF|nr:glycoside hydrolase family 16 protein [Piloderma croceum F 1598]
MVSSTLFCFLCLGQVLKGWCSTASNQCPENMPCCSEFGYCGTESFCLGGCNPQGSHNLTSCKGNPICQTANYTFEDTTRIANLTDYNGDATKHDFLLNSGNISAINNTLVLYLTEDNGGTRISSTRYVHYGTMTARMKTGRWAGTVAAFITMSDMKDEIDWESPGDSVHAMQSNWFYEGEIPTVTNGATHQISSDSYENYHDYTINYQQDQIQWLIDGQVVRTVSANSSNSMPSTPSRMEFSLWPAGINTSAPGTIQWAGGKFYQCMINWNDPDYLANGNRFQIVIESISVVCADSPPTGSTSYVYGTNTSAGPSIAYSNAPTTIQDATANVSPNSSSDGSSGSPGSSLGGSPSEASNGSGSGSNSKKIGIIAGVVAGSVAALIFGALIIRLVVRFFSGASSKSVEPYGFTGVSSDYQHINAPAPPTASELHSVPNLRYEGGRYN